MEKKKEAKEDRRRRCGFPRRSFTYYHHIPERRSTSDRREAQECDVEPEDQPMAESEKSADTDL